MCEGAVTAILYITFDNSEIAAALISEHIKRTVTEHTVEFINVLTAVTREVFTGSVLKESAIVFHNSHPVFEFNPSELLSEWFRKEEQEKEV